MSESMSKKEKLARGSAVIKVMKVNPRAGNFLKSFVDPRKLPRGVKPGAPKGVLADMPWLDVKGAIFEFKPKDAKIPGAGFPMGTNLADICDVFKDEDPTKLGLPDGSPMLDWFSYRVWAAQVNPLRDGNIAEHFNVLIGLLISMAKDCNNENFADVEAYPCIQFLKGVKSPDGSLPPNVLALVLYIEYVCQKVVDTG